MSFWGRSANRSVVKETKRMKSAVRWVLPVLAAMLLVAAVLPALAETVRPLTPGEGAEVYRQKVAQMSTVECGKCHYEIFTSIRDQGGRHQLECRECHNKFHTFTPGVAWADRVPACNDCHEGVHEGHFPQCLSCHQQAHAPIASLVEADKLAADCGRCHSPVSTALQAHPSGHAEMGCSDCHHDRHGFKPGCNECHPQPHTPFKSSPECLNCHPAHTPLTIAFGDKVENLVCQGCHEDPAAVLKSSKKRHAALKCVFCHAETHGTIPSCQQCHGNGPHNPELLKGFGGCLECHGDPHGLTLSGS